MSGIEVVAAVSAIISAFHGGSELLKHVKQKRRKSRQAQQEFEEKQLQDSLHWGEQQIGLRWTQDVRELGDYVRVGDATATDRLLHIAIIMQAEIIKSLQMAATHETAVLNLRILHEASIMNRKDTFTALDELKQRIIMTRPLIRQMEGNQGASRQRMSTASAQTIQSANFNLASAIPPDYIPMAVHLAPQVQEAKEPRHGFARYFQIKRNSSTSVKSALNQPSTPADSANTDLQPAFEQYIRVRGSEDRSVIMKDIDEMISSYKGLEHMSPDPKEPWGHNQTSGGLAGRQDTLSVLNTEKRHGQSTSPPYKWDSVLVPSSEEYGDHGVPTIPAFKNVFGPAQDQHLHHQHHSTKHTLPVMQTYPLHPRWSNTSATSSNYSGVSFDRNGSNSSQETPSLISPISSISSNYSSPPDLANFPPLSQKHQYGSSDFRRIYSDSSGSSMPVGYVSPIAPFSMQQSMGQSNAKACSPPEVSSPSNAPNIPLRVARPLSQAPYVETPQHLPTSSDTSDASSHQHVTLGTEPNSSPSRLPRMESVAQHDTSSTHSNASERTVLQPSFAVPTTIPALTPPTVTALRHPSISASIASTDSSGSGSVGVLPRPRGTIRSDTIQSPPLGQERMMEGRPCKDNNYWGFCKGAWAVREDVKKGLSLCTQPQGLYNTREIWECQHCNFWGKTFSAPHPTRRNKRDTIVDPNIHTSKSGIRYRWVFLAKSHVRRKSNDAGPDDCNYGCLICSVEGNVTGIYGNVDTLMYHILEHVADMTTKSMQKTKCIIGRTAGADEEWDINVPLFADVSEVEA